MINQPNLFLLIGFALGLYAASSEAEFWILAAAVLAWAGMTYLGRWREALLIAGAAAFAFFYWTVRVPEVPPLMSTPRTAEIVGAVTDFPVIKPGRTNFYLDVDSARPDLKRIRVVVRSEVPVKKGDKLLIKGQLETVREPGNSGEFDYKKYLERRQVYYVLTVKNVDSIRIVGNERHLIQDLMLAAREKGERTIELYLPEGTAGIAKGIVLGAADGINPQDYSELQKTGLAHVVAASGMNVGFVMIMGVWLADALKLSRRNKGWVAALLILLYGCLAGWPVSLLRAAVMAWLGLTAYYGGREPNLTNALAVSGLVMLLVNPVWVFELSFQLSFLATAGLVWLYPVWRQAISCQSKLLDAFLIPLAAQAATLPLIVNSFSLFSLSSVIANFLGAYLCGAALILGLAGFFTSIVFAPLAAVFLVPAGLAVDGVTAVSGWLSGLPGSYLWVAAPPLWAAICFYTGLAGSVFGLRCRDRRVLLGGLLLITAYLACVLLPGGMRDRGWLEVTFLDVGQGDSILVKTPQGKFMLVDCGGSQFWDVGQQVVVPALARKGLRKLDLLVITHPDLDHIGGAPSVIGEMYPRCIGVSASAYPGPGFEEMEEARLRRAVPVAELARGKSMGLDPDLAINVLYPEVENSGSFQSSSSANEDSVVIRMQYGKISFLLAGDIGASTMDMLVEEELVKPVTVVKVPHHGSKGSVSERFYKAASAKVAVISAGKNNPFGHPSPQTLELLDSLGVTTYRTDLDGAVIFRTDGERLFVKTVLKRSTFYSSARVIVLPASALKTATG